MTKVLLLSYAFQPDNTPAAARPSQLHRFLPENGVEPFVFASSTEGGINTEASVRRVPGGRQAAGTVFASWGARVFMRFLAPYNDRLPWAPHAASAAAAFIRKHPVDAIYSTSPFLASHFAALWLKSKFGLPWIADFQDPVCDNPFRSRRWPYPYDRIIEKRIFKYADHVIANTDAIAEVWRERYPERRERISVLWNSYDPDEKVGRPQLPPRGYRVLAHIGTLYGGRHPGQLLASLQRMNVDSATVRVKLIGPIDESVLSSHGKLFERMRDKGLLEFANLLVPREEALRETAEADCLLLLDVNERNSAFQVPSKVLDYIRIGKPILAYTPADSPVDRILAKSGIPYLAVAPDTPADVADAKLKEFLRLPLQKVQPSPWFEEKFSARTQARTLAGLLDELLAEKRQAAAHAGRKRWRTEVLAPVAMAFNAGRAGQMRPVILTTVDAEEEFDWYKPLARGNHSVLSMREQHVLHRIFEKYGVVPIYFVTYPIVTEDDGSAFLADCLKDKRCQIGSQLHPWVTPPFDEIVNAYNSFAGNLSASLEFAKLKTLTDAITERFGARPTAYRAGRYGIGPHTVKSLAALGYRIDSSVVPEFSYHRAGGPVFFNRPAVPYWLDRERHLLEVPLTSTYVGRLSGGAQPLRMIANGLFADDERYALSRALLARSGLMERIRLTPEGTEFADSKRLVRALLKRGTRIFTLSYHTPSLVPGNTPYVRSEADRARFLDWFEAFYDFFLGEIGGAPATVAEIYDRACSAPTETMLAAAK